jgi:hypothetical protein
VGKRAVGDRVGAILSASGDTCKLIGYGTYQGYHVPDDERVQIFGQSLKEIDRENPKIELDNGDIVWGCECWWGDEDAVKVEVSRYANVETIDINTLRDEHYGPRKS